MAVYRNVQTSANRDAATPQNQQAPGTVPNNAGGFSFQVNDWTRLNRFLIQGSEAGTYYVSEKKLTKDNAEAVIRCVKEDGLRAVKEIVEISDSGRAAKNDPAIFALALAASVGDLETQRAAFAALPYVCRIATHLLHFVDYLQNLRGWGTAARRAVAQWYLRNPKQVAFQVVKYQSRDSWSNRDLLRLSHPKPVSEDQKLLFRWITRGADETVTAALSTRVDVNDPLAIIWATEAVKNETDPTKIVDLVKDYSLPREVLPTTALNNPDVWAAMLDAGMPMTALIRSLSKMTNIELLTKSGRYTRLVVEQLTSLDKLRAARVHPITLLSALKVYEQGHGERGHLEWSPVSKIVDALDDAFYVSFKTVTPSNKRLMLAVDVSGSMGYSNVVGLPGIDCRTAAAALSLVTAATEPNTETFCFSTEFKKLAVSPNERLDSVIRKMTSIPFGGTDCSLPMVYAKENSLKVDGFIVYTDSETYFGNVHPYQALRSYRSHCGIGSKLVVAAFSSNEFSIAQPDDGGMLDCSGLDSFTPSIISDFLRF